MTCKLILNRGQEEEVCEFDTMEKAFDAALPRIEDGFIARVADKHGVVKYTQALSDNGQITVYSGDATATHSMMQEENSGPELGNAIKNPWWKFW